MAKLVPHVEERKPREPGSLKGKIWISPDFDTRDEQIERDFGMLD